MSAAHPTPSSNNDQGTMTLMALALILIAIVIFIRFSTMPAVPCFITCGLWQTLHRYIPTLPRK